ncbi:hypothetical protein GCM10010435_91500 [Winogradskya consettensis]|uniref:Ricin B lectin domain-containing protein n=1 Tax=Winogradskya consettensis TaxID=113560 RepID=A0A919SJ73_9ACTN|nr:RICIN domain-containing protein [Actinoplanes consettensis]GIM73402.1 hypothetical protein Aco04nite_35070 [Actinoplanes consettensis]
MADNHDGDIPEQHDPVLVRPYITTEPGGAAPAGHDNRQHEVWPHAAMLPEDATDTLPAVPAAPAPDAAPKTFARQRLVVLSGVAAIAVVAAAGFFLFTGDKTENPSDPAQIAAPVFTDEPGATGSLGAATSTSKSSPGTSAKASRSARASNGASAPAGFDVPAVPPAGQSSQGQTPTSAGTPTPTLDPPPAADITGPITGNSGRCLALGGLLGIDNTPIQTNGCSGVSYQSFTLTPDGTMRVAGHCTQVTDDGTVRTVGCDDRPSAQWRTGPGGTLINPASGLCLTDPGNSGATVRATTCTGAADQVWKTAA